MSILFSQVVKKTTIYFAVIAFFALFLSQTTFAAPTLTFDSPTKVVDVTFTIGGLGSNSFFNLTATLDDGTSTVVESKNQHNSVTSKELELSAGTWTIVLTELDGYAGNELSSVSQTLVVSADIETTLEVEIHDENGNVITTNALSGASIKPGYDVYVTYKADGPTFETPVL